MTTPVTEPVTPPVPTPPASVAPAAPPAPPAAAPPWGSDAEFDATKAWNLIEGLRADKEKLAARPVLTPEQQKQLEEYNAQIEAQKTEAQRLQEAATTAQRETETARAEATRYKVAAMHGITAENFDLLGEGTEAEITARAERLAALQAAQAAVAAPATPAVPPAPGQRPVEQLRPGATPTGTQTDDDIVYAALFGPPKT